MVHDRQSIHPQRARSSILATIFIVVCVLIAAFVVGGYSVGWVTFHRDDEGEKATIEVETGKVREAAEEAVDKGQELLQRADDQIRNLKTEDESEGSPGMGGNEGVPVHNTDGAPGESRDRPQG